MIFIPYNQINIKLVLCILDIYQANCIIYEFCSDAYNRKSKSPTKQHSGLNRKQLIFISLRTAGAWAAERVSVSSGPGFSFSSVTVHIPFQGHFVVPEAHPSSWCHVQGSPKTRQKQESKRGLLENSTRSLYLVGQGLSPRAVRSCRGLCHAQRRPRAAAGLPGVAGLPRGHRSRPSQHHRKIHTPLCWETRERRGWVQGGAV